MDYLAHFDIKSISEHFDRKFPLKDFIMKFTMKFDADY